MEKKIATSLEILIKVAQFESIRLTKYGEAKIEYDSIEERIAKEKELNDEVVFDMIASMRALPDQLGKYTNSVVEIEEKIRKRIPKWLEEGAEPNISNTSKKSCEKSEFESYAENEERKKKISPSLKAEEKTNSTTTELDELFSPDSTVVTSEIHPKGKEEVKVEAKEEVKLEEDNFGDDEDLFA